MHTNLEMLCVSWDTSVVQVQGASTRGRTLLCYLSGTQWITEVLEQCLEALFHCMVTHLFWLWKEGGQQFFNYWEECDLPFQQRIILSCMEQSFHLSAVSVSFRWTAVHWSGLSNRYKSISVTLPLSHFGRCCFWKQEDDGRAAIGKKNVRHGSHKARLLKTLSIGTPSSLKWK